ncbi:MAG TPA: hypothetical protein VGJ94_17470 [Syntrophorhabdaceae bacterium]|jgi:hypothetical protein
MSLTIHNLVVASVFAAFGFFLAFSLKRAAGILLFGVFAYASLKALDYLGVSTDWKLFDDLVHIITHLGKTILDMIKAVLRTATILSITGFLAGGVGGFILRR